MNRYAWDVIADILMRTLPWAYCLKVYGWNLESFVNDENHFFWWSWCGMFILKWLVGIFYMYQFSIGKAFDAHHYLPFYEKEYVFWGAMILSLKKKVHVFWGFHSDKRFYKDFWKFHFDQMVRKLWILSTFNHAHQKSWARANFRARCAPNLTSLWKPPKYKFLE